MTATAFLVATVFLACAVEAVEALTIVLAVGTTRGWRLRVLRLVVGGLLLVFGLWWLRKAILRASGLMAAHDEQASYTRQVQAARAAGTSGRRLVPDGYAFGLACQGVLLEGLEVVVIVITLGASQGSIPLAALGAALAVGMMLTSFGTFWGAEGAGVRWPAADAALLGILVCVLVVSLLAVSALRRIRQRRLLDHRAPPG